VKLWFGYSFDDDAKIPDETIREHASSHEELTQAFADTAEVYNENLADWLDSNPTPDDFMNV
jgi:hypothetical protein